MTCRTQRRERWLCTGDDQEDIEEDEDRKRKGKMIPKERSQKTKRCVYASVLNKPYEHFPKVVTKEHYYFKLDFIKLSLII